METESMLGQLQTMLKDKYGVTHRKAEMIVVSIGEAAANVQAINDERSQALFYLGNCYRLFDKETMGGSNIESLLLLIHYFLPKANFKLIAVTNIVPGLVSKITKMIESGQISLLSIKYSLAILTEIFLAAENVQIFWPTIYILIIFTLSGSDFINREATKCLEAVLTHQTTIRRMAAETVKKIIYNYLYEGKQTYLTHLNEIVKLFPIELVNDMAFQVKRKLNDEDNPTQLTQIYFFLDSVFQNNLVTSSVSYEILKELIQNTPTDHDKERLMSGYMQAMYENMIHLNYSNMVAARKYLSTCVSIFSELLLLRDKISRQCESLLREMLSICVKKQLWIVNTDDDLMGIEHMDLDYGSRSNPFVKVVCMLNDMLTSRYEDVSRRVLNILGGMAEGLDESAFTYVKDMIIRLYNQREMYAINQFSYLFGKITNKVGFGNIIDMYPISIKGDPSESKFEEANNLWLLTILAKYCSDGSLLLFIRHFFPVIIECSNKAINEVILLKRNIYLNILKRLWDLLGVFNKVERGTSANEVGMLLDEIEKNLNVDYDHFENVVRGLAELAPNLKNIKIYKKAYKFIPLLAKLLNMDSPLCYCILKSLSALSTICSTEYLDRVFYKNIVKLLTLKSNGELAKSPDSHKNLYVLIAISHGVNFNDSKVLPNNLSKEYTTLKLICELMSEDNTFQKKAYKYLFQAIYYMPTGFLVEAMTLLDNLADKVLVYSKGYRIGFLKICWYRLGYGYEDGNVEDMLQFVKKYLPEIVVSLREGNSKLRKMATTLFDLITYKMNKLEILENFMYMVCSGLASNSITVKTDAIHALTLALKEVDIEKSEKFILDLTDLLIVMLKQKRREVHKTILLYLKELFHHKLEKSKQLEILPGVLKVLFEEDEDSRMANINILRHFLLKLTKKHSQYKIAEMLPEDHRRIIRSVVKAETRLKKKKKYKARRKRSEHKEEYESETESEKEEPVDAMEEYVDEEEQERREKAKKNNLLLKYDLHKEDFHFVEEKRKKVESKKKDKEADDEAGVSYSEGRLIFKEVAKRGREKHEDSDDDEEMNQPTKRRRILKVDTIHQVKESGSSFKAARSGGDVRVKNKPEPYSFIQLNSKALNRRYRHKAEKVFYSIFYKKYGGLKGLKTKLLAR